MKIEYLNNDNLSDLCTAPTYNEDLNLSKWGPQIVKKETQGWVMTMTMTNHKNTRETFLNRLVKRCETEEIYENTSSTSIMTILVT